MVFPLTMENVVQTKAAQAAVHVLDRFWDGVLPVEPERIAARAGIVVCEKRNPGYTGKYDRLPKPTICFDSSQPPVRRRFTIAHELGHHFLGHESGHRDGPESFSTRTHDPDEVAANQFAAELLMPARHVTSLVQNQRMFDIDRLASIFKVSTVALAYRLKNLGLAR